LGRKRFREAHFSLGGVWGMCICLSIGKEVKEVKEAKEAKEAKAVEGVKD
jgi:hypothetical protein